MNNLDDYLGKATKSIFRFEYLQDFSATDADDLAKWKNNELDLKEVGRGWWEFLEDLHKRGVVTQRVRRVVRPMNEYTEFELEIHKETLKHGDKIKIIDDSLFQTLDINLKDFWLIDDEIALEMHYEPNGKYLGFSIAENTEAYVNAKNLLWRQSWPLEGGLFSKIS